jgi:hypothetical protein
MLLLLFYLIVLLRYRNGDAKKCSLTVLILNVERWEPLYDRMLTGEGS